MEGRDQDGASDARLAIAASRGDDEAFAVLYARYAPRIRGYLARLLDDEHQAQDLTHEVFVSALRRLRNDRPPIAFGPWLYRIARNASIDVHRRAQIVRQVPLPAPGEETAAMTAGNGPEAEAEVRQGLEDLRDLLGGLSDTHRAVLVLRELEGLSNTEIGQRLGVSRPAVEGLLFRARAKVRSEYEELVSGRRCQTVQAALDGAADGRRLTRREADLAARHMRACGGCRRHAWEAGLNATDFAHARQRARRLYLPVPLLLGAIFDRLHARAHALGRFTAEPPAVLSGNWGRAAAAASAVAFAGGAVAPHVRHAEPAVAAAPPVVVMATASAAPTTPARPLPVRSAAAGTTRLPAATTATHARAAGVTEAAEAAGMGAPATAAPTHLPEAPAPAPAPAPQHQASPAPREAAAAPAAPVPASAAPAAVAEVAKAAATGARKAPEALPAPVAQAVEPVVEPVADAVEQVAAPVLDTTALVSDAVGQLTEKLPAVPVPAPAPEPVAVPVPAPAPLPETDAVAPVPAALPTG